VLRSILHELRHHAPFTALGAAAGTLLALVLARTTHQTAYVLFYVFHPAHVTLSALVSTAMYRLHRPGKGSAWRAATIGYVAAIAACTLSDSLIPYAGELLLRLPAAHPHVGFLEEWWLVNPAALLGIGLAFIWPRTKEPHAGHVLVSTAASLFHLLMALGPGPDLLSYLGVFVLLFVAVWIPCCLSDIAFPLLFVPGPARRHEH